jgi:hypothetical protein
VVRSRRQPVRGRERRPLGGGGGVQRLDLSALALLGREGGVRRRCCCCCCCRRRRRLRGGRGGGPRLPLLRRLWPRQGRGRGRRGRGPVPRTRRRPGALENRRFIGPSPGGRGGRLRAIDPALPEGGGGPGGQGRGGGREPRGRRRPGHNRCRGGTQLRGGSRRPEHVSHHLGDGPLGRVLVRLVVRRIHVGEWRRRRRRRRLGHGEQRVVASPPWLSNALTVTVTRRNTVFSSGRVGFRVLNMVPEVLAGPRPFVRTFRMPSRLLPPRPCLITTTATKSHQKNGAPPSGRASICKPPDRRSKTWPK